MKIVFGNDKDAQGPCLTKHVSKNSLEVKTNSVAEVCIVVGDVFFMSISRPTVGYRKAPGISNVFSGAMNRDIARESNAQGGAKKKSTPPPLLEHFLIY